MDDQIRLVWSDEIPLDEGFYWIELSNGIRVIAELSDTEHGIVFSRLSREFTTDEIERYCGPIPEPVLAGNAKYYVD